MFDPQVHVRAILNAAHAEGRSHAEAVYTLTAVPPDTTVLHNARNLLADTLANSVMSTPALNTTPLAQGVYASAFSGFMQRIGELSAPSLPPEDVVAIQQAGEQIVESMRPESGSSRAVDTGLFDGGVP